MKFHYAALNQAGSEAATAPELQGVETPEDHVPRTTLDA
jgi:hypothetical protein